MHALGMRARQRYESLQGWVRMLLAFFGSTGPRLGQLIPTLADTAAAGSASVGRWLAATGRVLGSMARMSGGSKSTSCDSGRRSRHVRSGHAGAPTA